MTPHKWPSQYLKGYTEGFRQFSKHATKVYEIMFFDIYKYVYSESVFNTLIHCDKTQMLENFPSVQRMPSFFFRKLHLITVLLLICNSYMSWGTQKLCVGFPIFDSVSFLLKFIFLFNKMHGFFDFKTS